MEENPDFMEGFNPVTEETTKELINSMFDPENIKLKTEIDKPHAITGLLTLAKRARRLGFEGVFLLLDGYIEDFLEVMVSHKRKSREEFVKMFTSIQENNNNQEIGEKPQE